MKHIPTIALLLLLSAFVWLLYGNQPTFMDRRTSIARHNSDVSYPVFGAIIPTERDSKIDGAHAYFVDLATGTQRLLRRRGSTYTALTAIPDQPGYFLVVEKRYGKYNLIEFESKRNATTVLHEFDFEIRSPFMLGDKACALHPSSKTAKQALNYEIVCGGKAVRLPIMRSVLGAASTRHTIAFLDGLYRDVTLYVIEQPEPDGEVSLGAIKLPFDNVRDVFSYGGEIYVASWNRIEPVTLYRLVGDRVEPYSGLLVERLRAADPGAGNISWVGKQAVVITSENRRDGHIDISVRDGSGKALKSYPIDLTENMLR